jgi:hypothetical protein
VLKTAQWEARVTLYRSGSMNIEIYSLNNLVNSFSLSRTQLSLMNTRTDDFKKEDLNYIG